MMNKWRNWYVCTYQLTTAIVKEPRRLLADLNKSNRIPIYLCASDISVTGSRTGWPPNSHETLKARPFSVTATARRTIRDIICQNQIPVKGEKYKKFVNCNTVLITSTNSQTSEALKRSEMNTLRVRFSRIICIRSKK